MAARYHGALPRNWRCHARTWLRTTEARVGLLSSVIGDWAMSISSLLRWALVVLTVGTILSLPDDLNFDADSQAIPPLAPRKQWCSYWRS